MNWPTDPALLARAEAYAARPERERRLTRASLDELLSLYNALTGQRRSWCPSCEYRDFYAVVEAYLRHANPTLFPHTMSKLVYSIIPALALQTFVHEGYNKAVTADNLTNEDAEFFIKHGRADAFLKNGQPIANVSADAPFEDEADGAPTSVLEQEQAAHELSKQQLDTEKEAHAATSKALKAEKKVTAELTGKNEKLTRELAEAKAKLAAKAAPVTPAPVAPVSETPVIPLTAAPLDPAAGPVTQ